MGSKVKLYAQAFTFLEHTERVKVFTMSLYDGLEVETAPIPEIPPQDQEDSATQGNISENHILILTRLYMY